MCGLRSRIYFLADFFHCLCFLFYVMKHFSIKPDPDVMCTLLRHPFRDSGLDETCDNEVELAISEEKKSCEFYCVGLIDTNM